MMSVFYQRKPERDTPYRQMILEYDLEKGWHVRLSGGKLWGQETSEVLTDELVNDWDEGQIVYDRLYKELQRSGWRHYTPQENWEPVRGAIFQKKVNRELPKPHKEG